MMVQAPAPAPFQVPDQDGDLDVAPTNRQSHIHYEAPDDDVAELPSRMTQYITEGIDAVKKASPDLRIQLCRGHVSQLAHSILDADQSGQALVQSIEQQTATVAPTEDLQGDASEYRNVFGEDKYLMHVEIMPYERFGGECYVAWDLVLLRNPAVPGGLERKLIFKKAIIAGGPDLHKTALEHQRRLQDLASKGVPIVQIYDVHNATIYEELYPNTSKQAMLTIKREEEGWKELLGQLVHIAVVLDTSSYPSLGFTHDLIFDGNTFRYADGGFDLGSSNDNKPTNVSLLHLIQMFGKYESVIRQLYADKKAQFEQKAA